MRILSTLPLIAAAACAPNLPNQPIHHPDASNVPAGDKVAAAPANPFAAKSHHPQSSQPEKLTLEGVLDDVSTNVPVTIATTEQVNREINSYQQRTTPGGVSGQNVIAACTHYIQDRLGCADVQIAYEDEFLTRNPKLVADCQQEPDPQACEGSVLSSDPTVHEIHYQCRSYVLQCVEQAFEPEVPTIP